MSAAKLSLNIEQGADYEATVTILMPDGVTPFNLTGYTATGQIRAEADSATTLGTLTPTIPTGTDGVIVVSIPASDTANYTFRRGVYDIKITKAGATNRILQGDVLVSLAVTR